MEKGYLWRAHTMLKKIQESLQKQEREVTELLQTERRHNKATKSQITVFSFVKTLVKKVRTHSLQIIKKYLWIFQKYQ